MVTNVQIRSRMLILVSFFFSFGMEHEWKTVDSIHEQKKRGIFLLYMNMRACEAKYCLGQP